VPARYFPFSQDFNSDGEGWEFTDTFGDRALRTWAEVLSILDREKNSWKLVSGWDSVISRKVRQTPATVRREVGWMLARHWLDPRQLSASGQPEVLYARNYGKYRKLAAEASTPPSLPPNPPLQPPPISPKENVFPPSGSTESQKPELSVQDLVDSWNDIFENRLPKVQWPLTRSRYEKAAIRIKEHRTLDFWQRVFDNIGDSRFLLGTGNGNWKCTFDFITKNDSNAVKIYEGAYRG
jgi:hypothetical protein